MNFSLPNERTSTLHVILLILFAYAFSVGMRLIWIDWASGIPEFHWNGSLMINTNDGYYFAAAAQNSLTGIFEHNPRVAEAWSSATITLTALAAQFFPLESVILYLPVFVSSLVVVPLILIGRLFNAAYFGFFAALIASIAWSYYNRTMAGYYDTDMFSAMAPMLIVYFLMATTIRENVTWALLSALSILAYPFLYDQGLSVIYAVSLFYMGYMLLFHRKEPFTYYSIALLSVALFLLPLGIKLLLIGALSLAYSRGMLSLRVLLVLAAFAFAVFLVNGNVVSLIWAKILSYTAKGTATEGSLHFFQVTQTVREAGKIPFSEIANRISGNTAALIAASLGYIALIVRHKAFVLTLPLLGIGLFAFWGGLRFTIYAVPVAALGAVYLLYFITAGVASRKIRYAIIGVSSAVLLLAHIVHIVEYKVPTVMTAKEAAALDQFKSIASSKDYTVAWWDYGYPLWFYTHTNTLIDGGKHHHDNFIVSEILTTSSPLEAARLSRIAVETYVSSGYKEIADTLFIRKDGTAENVADYLDTLRYSENVALPAKTREVYLYLPWRMIDILPTVTLFSNLDLNAPDNRPQPYFYMTASVQDTGKTLDLGNGVSVLKERNIVKIGDRDVPIKEFYQAGYDGNNKLQVTRQQFASEGINLIYLPSYGRFLVLDDFYLNSTFIQMAVFERYDPKLFEPVILDPLTKIYRLKL
ncbi:MAG: STT3 domain-containing protein [Campylobacterota bacterium]